MRRVGVFTKNDPYIHLYVMFATISYVFPDNVIRFQELYNRNYDMLNYYVK